MDAQVSRHAELDARLCEAVKPIKLMADVSWPSKVRDRFLQGWHAGNPSLPQVEYPKRDFSSVHEVLREIHDKADPGHPLGEYLRRTVVSYQVACDLLQSLGQADMFWHSMRLFGRPGDKLPGSELSNLDAARHFVGLAADVDAGSQISEADYVLSAATMQYELQEALD